MANSFLSRLSRGDRALFLRLALQHEAPSLTRRMWRAITHLGGARFTLGVTLAPLAVGGQWRDGSQRALAILILSHVIVQGIKRTVGRPRPSRGTSCVTLIAEPDKFSFPSGHAAAAMSVALGFASVFPTAGPLLAALAIVVGFSRVALAVHYPGDVVAGQCLAVVTGAALWIW